ncbi:MAG: hypothetical protein A2Y91_04345 [Chloroflexi bacterium RBG_13_54_8]|nr:MAG: hypothetical protein A2Y91_04345 [Chloroflexi bacterium RBG_13_54_8]
MANGSIRHAFVLWLETEKTLCAISLEFFITSYVQQALSQPVCDKLEDSTFASRVPQSMAL